MASLLPRGIPSPVPQDSKPPDDLPSPSEDLNLTVQKLLASNSSLEEKVRELEGDKKHFQSKLEEYIRYDREEVGSSESHDDRAAVSKLEKQISKLVAENADLHFQLHSRGREAGDSYLTAQQTAPQVADREQRAALLHRLNELQASSQASQDYYGRQLEMLRVENSKLRQEAELLRRTHHHYPEWKARGGQLERPPSWEPAQPAYQTSSVTEGYSSLPESLTSSSSGSSSAGGQSMLVSKMPDLASLRIGNSDPTPPPPAANAPPTAAELKKLKRQLEKYKTANIELDQKLKDAKLELQKFAEGRRDCDVAGRMDLERLRSENAQLRARLDRALSENSHLRSMVGRGH